MRMVFQTDYAWGISKLRPSEYACKSKAKGGCIKLMSLEGSTQRDILPDIQNQDMGGSLPKQWSWVNIHQFTHWKMSLNS